jgi:GNAT superfamily N-acetyltransferase
MQELSTQDIQAVKCGFLPSMSAVSPYYRMVHMQKLATTGDMKVEVQIREAASEDVETMLGLYEYLSPGDERCPLDLARRNLDRLSLFEGSAVLLGAIDGEVLTTCTLIVAPNFTRGGRPYAIIENVVTHPEHRGRGLGTTVLDAACDRAWNYGCYKVMLSTGSSLASTIAFYESAGFEKSRTGFQKRRLPKRLEISD